MQGNPTLFKLPRMEKYSIAICPPDAIVAQVKEYKQLLYKAIGRDYPSRNADAHISFETFEADEEMIGPLERSLEKFCLSRTAFEIRLSGTGTFRVGTFYLSPDETSYDLLRRIIADANNLLFRKNLDWDSYVPHMSIARSQLTQKELTIAQEIITNVDLSFTCDNIAIRKLDPKKGQYDVYKRFYFNR